MVSYSKVVLVSLCTCGVLVATGCKRHKEVSAPERLLHKDGAEVKQARDELVAARKVLVGDLVAIIKEKKNRLRKRASVEAAMFVLGEMRAVEAVEVLVDHIGFPYVHEGGGYAPLEVEGGMWHKGLKGIGRIYAAAQALIKIGEPCIESIMNKLSVTEGMNERLACFGVLVDLKGEATGQSMLKDAIEGETESKKKERLQRSLEFWLKIPQEMKGG